MKDADALYNELLVLRAQSGDSNAMAELVERWQPRLWTLAGMLTSKDDAWDVTQEAWLTAVRDLVRLRSPAGFGPWMYRIVRNKAADKIRQRRRDRKFAEEPPVAVTEHPDTDASDVRTLLATLPEQDRAVLTLHYLEGMRYEEMATILDVPIGSANHV